MAARGGDTIPGSPPLPGLGPPAEPLTFAKYPTSIIGPDDPIEAAAGAFAGEGPKIDWEAFKREEREAEAEAEDRKFGR